MDNHIIQEIVYRYDSSSDTLGIKVIRDFKYDETIEMDDGTLFDFDVDCVPVSLEILDASQRFDLDNESLKNIICLEVDICVDEKSISISSTIGVLIEDTENKQVFESHASNYAEIPEISTKLTLA